MSSSVDILFIDEAGQFSLANTIAVVDAADTLVLLGDPSQLQQPQQGVHPLGAGASALEHLLGGATTLPPEKGLSLEKTYSLHPDITRFTSQLFYGARLASAGSRRMAACPTGSADVPFFGSEAARRSTPRSGSLEPGHQ